MYLLPEALVERLKNRRAVLVTGLGCSQLAGLPSWSALCERLSDWIEGEADKNAVLDLLHGGQLSTATALIRDLVPEQTLVEVLRDAYPMTTQVPEAIRASARAPWRGVITTALDALWTSALAGDAEVADRMVFAGNVAALESGRGRFLIQLFGRADVPASLCLAPAEVGAKIVATGATQYLESLHKKWSFVFVGFAPNDPDLSLLAGRILGASPSTCEHFFVAPKLSAIDTRRVKAEFGLVPVSVEGSLDDVLTTLTQNCALAGDKPAEDDAEAWLERLIADPDDSEADRALDRGLAKLRADKEWERLVGILVGRAEHKHDLHDQAADLHAAGIVLDEELSAADRAYPVLMMALHLTPHNAALLTDAKRVAGKVGQANEFMQELHEIEKQSAGSAHADPVAMGLARLLADDPARQKEAITAFQKVLDRDPNHAEALAGLEEIYERTGDTAQLIELLQARLARNPDEDRGHAKLEALYQKTQRWQPLGALYERVLAKNPNDLDAQNKLEALYQKTQQWQPLGALYERQLAQNPDNDEVLDRVENLYRQSEQWRPLADSLERRASKKAPAEARALRLERAAILIEKIKDSDGALAVARGFLGSDVAAAEEIFAKCLDRDPGNPAALLALAELARAKGDYLRAAKFTLDSVERTQNPLELGRLLADAGGLYLDHLNDDSKAVELFERALAADPEQMTAANRLLPLRERREEWAAVEPLLDVVLRKTPDGDAAKKADLHQRAARCARKLAKFDKAAAALASATTLDAKSPALARDLADLHFEREAWAEARAEYERTRLLLGGAGTAAERAALLERLAICSIQTDDLDAALRYYEEALALEPEKRDVLEKIIDLRTVRGDWKELLALKRRLLPLVDDAEKAKIVEQIGDVMREKLDDWPGAMDAYRQALVIQPDRRQTLYKTLEYHTVEREWPSAIATLQKLAELESDPLARAKCNYAMAAIYRDEEKDSAKAIGLFTKVLDDSPLYPKAFDAIEKILVENKELKELERAYRKQIKRLPQDASVELKLRLWDGLADVALKQHDKESAALTMEVALSLDRENMARQEQLAKMYFDMGPSAADKAIAQHQFLISKKPDRLDSYKALASLFFQAGEHDKMWCVAGAMTCLGKADPPLQALYENFRPTQTPPASGKLNEELWRKIVHPNEDPYLSALFALLSPAIAMSTAQPRKVLGLDRDARVDVTTNAWPHSASLRYVANSIEATLPDVFIKKDAPGSISLVNLKDKNTLAPALVIGIGFQQLASHSEVIFDFAKRMVLLRPERFPRFALGTGAALEIAVRAGLQLGGAPIGKGDHGTEVDKMAKKIDGLLSTPLRAELKGVAKRYVEACGDQVDIPRWIVASDLTAARAALVLCGDIVAAARVLALEPSGQSPLSVPERLNDLLVYFTSNDHFAVRAALGMKVNLAPMNELAGTPQKRRMSHMQIKAES
jgi:tetratricopeptide (TPR) repeat protein